MSQQSIVLASKKLDPAEVRRLVQAWFVDMVKVVVDVRRSGMEIQDADIRQRVRDVVWRVLGRGEPL